MDSPARYADDSDLASASGDVVTTMWLPMRDMGLGDAGTDVGMLQEAFGLPATGVYDKNTSRKIAQWQAANNLPRSGYFGAASREVFARSAQMQMRRVVVTSETYGTGAATHPVERPRRAPTTNIRATRRVVPQVGLFPRRAPLDAVADFDRPGGDRGEPQRPPE